jgi:NACHT domain
LQSLLAVRVTDAPELDADRAREAVRLALTAQSAPAPGSAPGNRRNPATARSPQRGKGPREVARGGSLSGPDITAGTAPGSFRAAGPAFPPPAARYAARLSEYFDDKISALVATLEGRVGFAGLAQVRAEAYNARIVALLGAIERQVAALADPGHRTQAEADFLVRYRRQAHQRHGFLTPPDFDRRRRVPAADIYVPTGISEDDDPDRMRPSPHPGPDSVNVWDLVGRLDRTVLLGDPGGGKTTAANVLADHFADGGSVRVAFLVTLREYAAKTPIEWSVTEHIEHNLKTLYQTPAPDGLVERLLLTGRAVVIFDGLDELLDTSRRRDVSDRVEQFCAAYPLAPVLVTSRVVGYDQARLDDTQFSCYRLGGFGDDEVAEYAGKWFRSQEGLAPAEATAKAAAFLAESAHATDLRANPLLLSLMCILYRGAGSLPGDRAGIYARCAELLLRKWDEQRDLYRKLGSDHLVEPTLRYIAWWLLTREGGQTAATERELVAKAAHFLYERGYESEDEAKASARELIEFCSGRMWVFTDAGTTADGEKLYGFTHRTFLEYFAAWHLAARYDSPEELARFLRPLLFDGAFLVVVELAVQIKDRNSDRGTDRIFTVLLDLAANDPPDQAVILSSLAEILESTRPSRQVIRRLTNAAIGCYFDDDMNEGSCVPIMAVLEATGSYSRATVADAISIYFSSLSNSADTSVRAKALLFALEVPARQFGKFWDDWAGSRIRDHSNEMSSYAALNVRLRRIALSRGFLTIEEALEMPGGISTLMVTEDGGLVDWLAPYPLLVCQQLLSGNNYLTKSLSAIGRHLQRNPPPWAHTSNSSTVTILEPLAHMGAPLPPLDAEACLGLAAVMCMSSELAESEARSRWELGVGMSSEAPTELSELIAGYISQRSNGVTTKLPVLPIPTEFRQLFQDWAERRVNFVAVTDE